MEDNEDEPEDVRKATPVADEIESGRKDEKDAKNAKGNRNEKKDDNKSSRCDKDAKKPTLAKSEADCCRSKITKSPKTPQMMSVMVYSPPCTLPRLEIIPRHCLSKQEYINILASPSRKCPPECFGKSVVRKIRPISARMNELAQPARRLIVGTLKERGETLPPEMINNLVKSIEGSTCMTPEQAEKYFRDKERGKERKVGKIHGRQKCKGKSKRDQCSSQLDKEAVMCQYLMAERFVKSILRWKCPIPVEEFQDIASVILRRLSFVLEYTPIDGEDLKSQQMRFLADIIACWISGVLFEVAEEHKKEIEEELIARKEEEEDEDEDEEEEEEDEEDGKEVEAMEENVEETDDDDGEREKDKEEDVIRKENEKEDNSGTQKRKDGGNEDGNPANPVVIKREPPDEVRDDSEELAAREKATKEAEEKEQERLAADKKKKEEQEEEERARKEAEERDKIEKEEEAKRKVEAEEKKLREEKEEEEKKKKKKQEEEEEENKLRIEAEEKKKKKEQEEEEEKRKKKELEEEEEKKKQKELEEEEEKRKQKELEEEEEKRKKKEQEEEEERKMKKAQEEEEEKRLNKEQEVEKEKRMKKEQAEEVEKRKRQEQKEAEEERKKKLAEDQKKKNKKKEEEAELKRMGPKKAIEGIGDGELFETDLPFVTFGKILDTVYNMLEEEPEGDDTDIIHNRIQRSLYEKFARLIELESPDSLTENLKDVVDVFAGKAATWVRKLLKDSELEFMNDNPAKVESKEIRDWGKWIDQVTDRAGDWADWIHRVVNEAEEKSATIVQRGDWQNWTSDTETNALLWRRYYLETIHQAHHNKMMIVDRPVVQTGLPAVEEEIKNTDLTA